SALQALARKLSGVLVIDEAYVDFSSENAIDFAQRFENVLVTRSFSKSYGLAGMRIGFAAGNASLIEALLKVKDSYNVDRLAQVAALAAFQDTAYLRSTVDRVRKTRKKLTGGLRKLGWEVLDSEANFVFGKPPRPAGEVMAALRRAKILVRHFPGPRTGESLRISVGTDREIELLLRALGRTSGGTV
ncbi:MAG: aminotransferase class I/II-fold pyridoxal phosphate-dependent enzyme, partial [Verrucomicrobiae bacterium]|nr:aminotransferase class I/II-fold pyridoxal phosphate-dependent enzyme [Verrucomicrobiae bacterium]